MNFKGSSYPEILPDLINEMLDTEDAMFLYFIELKGNGLDELFEDAGESIDGPDCSLSVFKKGVSIEISIRKDAGILLCPKSKDEAVGLLAELLLACDGFDAAKKNGQNRGNVPHCQRRHPAGFPACRGRIVPAREFVCGFRQNQADYYCFLRTI